ncbi:MAG TPA: hypothetical protein VJT82_11455 [Pyrinomonadaceae bacterium]|nr:hypothetical protein [Pyrinomonadaceae bacterium]
MAHDPEVEKVLLEIRQNLHAEIDARAERDVAPNLQVLSQLESHLTVTGRAWSRLPPVSSNRHGWRAQVELWLKRQLKRATRWYVWEQLNFNAATNDALRAIQTALANQEKQHASLRAELEELRRGGASRSGDDNR